MLAYHERDMEAEQQRSGRYHPWTTTQHTDDGRYVDFKANPDQILETLEDLRGLEETAISRSVVDLLSWANSEGQPYETNDFGLRPVKPNQSLDVNPRPLELAGRVTFLFRNLRLNCDDDVVARFTAQVIAMLHETDPDFTDGCIGVSRWPHLFTELAAAAEQPEGQCFVFNFWAWGDDEASTYAAADRVLANLRTALIAVAPRVIP